MVMMKIHIHGKDSPNWGGLREVFQYLAKLKVSDDDDLYDDDE